MGDGDKIDVTLEVRMDMRNTAAGFGSLTVREDFRMPVASFTELAGILGRFHALAEDVKATHE